MYENETGVYFCKRLRVLEWLSNKGFTPFTTIPDRYNPRYSVWLFKSSPELDACIKDFYAARTKASTVPFNDYVALLHKGERVLTENGTYDKQS